MIYEDCRRSPALSPNLKNRLKYIVIARRVPIAPALLILGDEIANLATLISLPLGDWETKSIMYVFLGDWVKILNGTMMSVMKGLYAFVGSQRL